MSKNETAAMVESVLRGLLGYILIHPGKLRMRIEALSTQVVISGGSVHKADMGRVIGEGRRNFNALSALLEVMGGQIGIPIRLYEFDEPYLFDKLTAVRRKFDINQVADLIESILEICAAGRPVGLTICKHETFANSGTVGYTLKASIDIGNAAWKLNEALQTILDSIGWANGNVRILLDLCSQPDALQT